MQVLVASPGLSFHLHAPRVSPLRARAMADAGLQVEFLAYRLSSLSSDAPLEGIPTHGIREEATGVRAGMMDFLSRRTGRVWPFIAEPFLVQRHALRRAFRAGTRVVYVTDLDPITMLPALWLTPRRIRRAVTVLVTVSVPRDICDCTRAHDLRLVFGPETANHLFRASPDTTGRPDSSRCDVGRRHVNVAEAQRWLPIDRQQGYVFGLENTEGIEILLSASGEGR